MHIHLATHPNLSHTAPVATQKFVCIDDLLPPGFMRRHSQFRDVNHMLTVSGMGSEVLAEADSSSGQTWDNFIRLGTTFPSWKAMLREARGEWIMRRIGIFIDA